MINDPKDIAEILKALDKITFEQLDKAIKSADKEYEQLHYSTQYDIYNIQNEVNAISTSSYSVINSQQIEILDTVIIKEKLVSEEGENVWKEEIALAA